MKILNLDINEVCSKEDLDSDDDNEHLNQQSEDSNLIERMVKNVCMDDIDNIKADIKRLSGTSLITDDVKNTL